MKKALLVLICLTLLETSCQRSSGEVWEDTKTTSRYMNKGGKTLWNINEEERLAQEKNDLSGPIDEEFIPLDDSDLRTSVIETALPQPRDNPGEPGSGIPSLSAFQNPTQTLASIFSNVYFNTDEHVLRSKEHVDIVNKIATYLKQNPNLYITIEGHCDERGPEAYNLSLGSRRANYVRSLLVKQGVDLNRIYTVSKGKEQPLDPRHDSEAWAKNRRAEFKIFQK